ncbi:MAG: type VI secretion system-associated protein TagF [Thiotrichaceae bacterium]|nr:type VI secretion system-associated protein TagF [Thiotrichaceae bacterium]
MFEKKTGLYGKLPMHGDFIHRNLPTSFLTPWDEWLQCYIAGAREQIGDEWLNIYLTSPIWRFALSAGVIDQHHWAGIILPSVDQVGRYYPFSIARQLPPGINPLEFMSSNTSWFEGIEELALQTLDEQHQVDELIEEIDAIENGVPFNYHKSVQNIESDSIQINMTADDASSDIADRCLLDSLLTTTHNSYSVWRTQGSELITPCLLATQGLPSIDKIPAMIDGQWADSGWAQPYRMI